MIFRPLELAFGKLQNGFTLFSFQFEDGTYYSLLALLYDDGVEALYFSFCFMGFVIDREEEE